MRAKDLRLAALRLTLAASAALASLMPARAQGQAAPGGRAPDAAAPPPATQTSPLKGRTVEDVRILGNAQVPSSVIRNVIRTRAGEPYDPATVEEDYHRVFDLKKFSNVEPQVEPTDKGVVVVFVVTEQRLIKRITWRGNRQINTPTLEGVTDLKVGQAIDTFRIALAKQHIAAKYREENFPFVQVDVPTDPLTQRGELIFNVVEGPQVRIRNIEFVGARTFSSGQLGEQIRTATWFPVFRPGKYDPEQVEEDMGALRKYYQDRGFFDVRVGRKLIYSPDNTELQVDFLIDEGPRYVIRRVRFASNEHLSDARLLANLRLREGMYYDAETVQRDVKQLVTEYSPFGYIYVQPGQQGYGDADYLRIDPQPVYLLNEPGQVDLLYNVHEGKPFRVGRILVKGNNKSQDKLIYREFREFVPGDVYDSGAVADAVERMRGRGFFQAVSATPIGDDPKVRDLLVEVAEAKTASFTVGAGISTNGGIGGNITYDQRNFDIANIPNDPRDILSEHAFTGAGQGFRASFNPGTIFTTADLQFSEPWLFDQPYSFTNDLYLRDAVREHYFERRIGDRVSFGKQFDYEDSAAISLRGERVEIGNIDDPRWRPAEILDARGAHLLTSVGLQFRRDTTNPGFLPYKGYVVTGGIEAFGALGGDYNFQRFTAGWSGYQTLYKDLLDRRTILALHAAGGSDTGRSVFFERFYGGGIGSIRGFEYRGVGPRAGRGRDPVGGDFSVTGTAEVSFPIYENMLRGVVFTDVGDIESDVKFGVLRASVGAGVRFTLPFLSQAPLAIDFGIPISKAHGDQQQAISFSLGLAQF